MTGGVVRLLAGRGRSRLCLFGHVPHWRRHSLHTAHAQVFLIRHSASFSNAFKVVQGQHQKTKRLAYLWFLITEQFCRLAF